MEEQWIDRNFIRIIIIHLCAAFWLTEEGKVGYDGHVKQGDVDKLLSEWESA